MSVYDDFFTTVLLLDAPVIPPPDPRGANIDVPIYMSEGLCLRSE